MEITLEEIQKKFESLPENLKWAIMGANVDDTIIDIAQGQGLNVEQMGQLSLETYMEMFGFTHPDKFEDSVQKSMQLSAEKTHIIVEEINEQIFKKIREKMGENREEEITETSTTSIPATNENTEEQENTRILKDHGIEIIPEKLELADGEKIHSILTQKLSTSFQTPIVKTEHSLDNITKVNNIPTPPTTPSSVMANIKPPSPETGKLFPSYSTKGDPYREIPE